MEYQEKPYQCINCGQYFPHVLDVMNHQTIEEWINESPTLPLLTLNANPYGLFE